MVVEPTYFQSLPRALLHPRYWLSWLLLFILLGLSRLPLSWIDALGRAVGKLRYRYDKRRVAIARLNMRWSFPDMDTLDREQLLCRYLVNQCQSALLLPRLLWESQRKVVARIIVDHPEHLASARARGPVMAISCHTNIMNLGFAAISWHQDTIALYRHIDNALYNWLVGYGRQRFRFYSTDRRGGMRLFIRSIAAGRVGVNMCDEDHGPSSADFAPLFGHQKATRRGAIKIAGMTGASLVPVCPAYLGRGRILMRVWPVLAPVPEDSMVANLTRINQMVEQMICADPAQYMWHLKIYKTRPDGTDSPYHVLSKSR